VIEMTTKSKMNLVKRNEQMMITIALIAGLVIGIILQQLTNESFLVIIYTTITSLGAYFLISMPFADSRSDYVPSQQSFRMVWGALLTTIGALLLVNVYEGVELWIAVVVLLVVVALLVAYTMTKNQKGGQ